MRDLSVIAAADPAQVGSDNTLRLASRTARIRLAVLARSGSVLTLCVTIKTSAKLCIASRRASPRVTPAA